MSHRMLSRTAFVLIPLLLGATPAHAKGGDPWQAIGVMAVGPAVLIACLAAMAAVYVIAAAFRRHEWIVATALLATDEAARGKFINTLWGLLAEILLICAGLVFARFHANLLMLLVWLAALALAGLGACGSAESTGRRFHGELAGGEVSPLTALGLGLRILAAAAAMPILGWIVVGLMAANGVGSILTTASSSRQPE